MGRSTPIHKSFYLPGVFYLLPVVPLEHKHMLKSAFTFFPPKRCFSTASVRLNISWKWVFPHMETKSELKNTDVLKCGNDSAFALLNVTVEGLRSSPHRVFACLPLETLPSPPHIRWKKKRTPSEKVISGYCFHPCCFANAFFFFWIYFTKAHNHKQGPCFSFSLRWPLQSWKHWICSGALFVERKQKWMKINPLITRCWQKWISGHAHIWEIFT